MADRPYLTSAEAATYCGFKTIGGIQQAVRRGKLKPAGKRRNLPPSEGGIGAGT